MADWQTAYQAWSADKSPGNIDGVLKSVQPTIDYTLASIGASQQPAVAIKAKTLAVKAIQQYDPQAGAALPTYLSAQLKPLARYNREVKSPIGASERHLLEGYHLFRAEQELTDKLDREPTLQELSEYAKLPVKRIAKLKRTAFRSPSDAAGLNAPVDEYDYDEDAMEYAYAEADTRDKLIMEHKLGYGGKKILPPKELAVQMGISPVELSRRSAKLALKINDYSNTLRKQG